MQDSSPFGRDYPPTNEAGFLAFARSLADPSIDDAIREAEPLSPIYGIRRMENRLRPYERLQRRPEGFLVLGDASCALNPVYGQGMTVAALSALTLNRSLCRQEQRQPNGDLTGLAATFQRRLARMQRTAWLLATAEDFRVPDVEGGHPNLLVPLLHRYIDAIMLVAANESAVHLVVAQVLRLVRPPAALFHPQIVARLLERSLAPRRPA